MYYNCYLRTGVYRFGTSVRLIILSGLLLADVGHVWQAAHARTATVLPHSSQTRVEYWQSPPLSCGVCQDSDDLIVVYFAPLLMRSPHMTRFLRLLVFASLSLAEPFRVAFQVAELENDFLYDRNRIRARDWELTVYNELAQQVHSSPRLFVRPLTGQSSATSSTSQSAPRHNPSQ